LGAIPITELDPHHYRHLKDAPIVYNNKNWNLNGSEYLALMGLEEFPTVNRNMVFEEYWMEYIERIVGGLLRWWDRNVNETKLLREFAAVMPSHSRHDVSNVILPEGWETIIYR